MNLHTTFLNLEQKTTKMITKIPPKYSIPKDGDQMVSINSNFMQLTSKQISNVSWPRILLAQDILGMSWPKILLAQDNLDQQCCQISWPRIFWDQYGQDIFGLVVLSNIMAQDILRLVWFRVIKGDSLGEQSSSRPTPIDGSIKLSILKVWSSPSYVPNQQPVAVIIISNNRIYNSFVLVCLFVWLFQ